MSRRLPFPQFLWSVAACVLLAGCGIFPEPTVKLVTNRAEMAAYVERYNAVQKGVRVEISYQEEPDAAVLSQTALTGDVVVGEWLASPAVMDRFDYLGDLVKPGTIDPSWFYQGLIAMGSRDNRPVLIPVSFSLPAVVFHKPSVTVEPPLHISLDTMRSMSGAFTVTGKNGLLTTVGFSPLWNPDFLSALALLSGARFRPGRNGLPAWDQEGLTKTVEQVGSWLTTVNASVAADQEFTSRYLIPPYYKLLSPPAKKILFALYSFPEFYALPKEKRQDFDFRWLSNGSSIAVMDNVLFAGVLRSSRNKRGARAFLKWFFSVPVQRSLLEINQSLRIGVFGIANGFSSLKSINEKELPQKDALLLGRMPPENLLVFPENLPDNWHRIRDEVVRVWIARTAKGEEDQPLEKRLEEWAKARKK